MLGRVFVQGAASALDRAAVAASRWQSGRSRSDARADRLGHEARLSALAAIREAYGGDRFVREPAAFFPVPTPVGPRLSPVRRLASGAEVIDASWPSEIEPFLPAVRERYLAHERNRTAYARLYVGREPRPTMVLIHGYLAGQWSVEERVWPIEWLDRCGMDVALVVLPFHALRGRTDRKGPPPFPGSDPRFSNEGFRQAVFDLRALVAFLRARGAPSVGVMGMSLGGYTTSLFATLEDELAFAVPVIPLASLADFARDHGRLGSATEANAQHPALEAANFVVSPLARPSRVPRERVLVLGAEADRITPIAHAERVARHFDARLVRMTGGHLLQVWRGDGYREVGRFLGGLGLLAARR